MRSKQKKENLNCSISLRAHDCIKHGKDDVGEGSDQIHGNQTNEFLAVQCHKISCRICDCLNLLSHTII